MARDVGDSEFDVEVLERSYVAEAQQALAAGDLARAQAMFELVLDLAPTHATANLAHT